MARVSWKVTVSGGVIAPESPVVRHFPTKKEAGWYAESERKAAIALRLPVPVVASIERVRNLSMPGAIWAAELGIKEA